MTKQTGVPEYRDSSSLAREFPVGSRVQLHAATGDWMRGDRYGEVTGYGREREYVEAGTGAVYRQRPVMVKLDKSKKVKRFHPANLFALERGNPKARDPAHRKLLKKLDTHFARDEKALRKNPRRLHHRAHYPGGVLAMEQDRVSFAIDVRSDGSEYRKGEPAFITMIPTGADDSATVYVQSILHPYTPPFPVALKWLSPQLGKKGWPKGAKPKKNPDAFVIALRNGGKRMTYDATRNRFTDNSKPSLYRTQIAAKDRALALLGANPKLARYKVTIEPASESERGSVFGARPRRQNPKRKFFAPDNQYSVWISGQGPSAKINAATSQEAARKAYGDSVLHVSGTAMGQNPAIYTAADGSGMTIKVWKVRRQNPKDRAEEMLVFPSAASAIGGVQSIRWNKRFATITQANGHVQRVALSKLPKREQWTAFNLADAVYKHGKELRPKK